MTGIKGRKENEDQKCESNASPFNINVPHFSPLILNKDSAKLYEEIGPERITEIVTGDKR
jgi:hypothetical protein